MRQVKENNTTFTVWLLPRRILRVSVGKVRESRHSGSKKASHGREDCVAKTGDASRGSRKSRASLGAGEDRPPSIQSLSSEVVWERNRSGAVNAASCLQRTRKSLSARWTGTLFPAM